MTRFFIRLHAALLRLYPRHFRAEFGSEMRAVFSEAITQQSGYPSTFLLRELRDLPGSLIEVYSANWLRGGNMSTQNEPITPSTRWQAFIGMLPFLVFGLACMIDTVDYLYNLRGGHPDLAVEMVSMITKIPLPLHDDYLALYLLALIGLGIGWKRGFPLWSYSYLGWSLVFAWFWAFQAFNNWYWLLGITVLIALLWTHSLEPLKKMLSDIWNDWTRLSLAMFSFIGFMALIYDENHHPQLFLFMLASILVISAGAWFFMRSSSLKGRVFSIIGSFVAAVIISSICEATWDFHAYHGLQPPDRLWYQSLGLFMSIIAFWLAILFWPALIALIHRITNRRTATQ